MSSLYPLLLIPIFDERPWGLRDLRPVYTKVVKEPIGESWLTWHDNRIANGPFRGRTLGDIATEHKRALVGSAAVCEDRFPLLVKFLFPAEKLSVQVHPDDAAARRTGEPCGKTECWYVLDAQPGAQVALGLKGGTTTAEFAESIRENRAEELLNWINVYPGDMLFVAAGTVHTIGGGMVLVETQQTSDITYRLYDYGRGRKLRIKEGIAAVKLNTRAGKVVHQAGDDPNTLVRSPFFQVEKLKLRTPLDARVTPESPHIIVAIGGSGIVESPGMEPISFAEGEAVVVPATVPGYSLRPQWDLEVMRMSVPSGSVAEPVTKLG
jgi:mannose-6-phosphate isomerase